MSTQTEEAHRNVDLDNRPERSPAGSAEAQPAPRAERSPDLRRLKIAGVALPVLFILALEAIRFGVLGSSASDYSFHGSLAVTVIVAVVAFSFVMFHFIERAQAETAEHLANLRRRQREGHGLYDVLLRISNQNPLADTLGAVAGHARDLLAADEALIFLNEQITRSVQLDSGSTAAGLLLEGACIHPASDDGSPAAGGSHTVRSPSEGRAIRSADEIGESVAAQIDSRGTSFGELWLGRRSPVPFTERDRQFLATLSDLASIAVTGARMRESERQGAILAERERIARELHDSLAQVLGATHLRLRTLAAREEERGEQEAAGELADLADVCEDGYRDVRGAILDLRESSRTDRDLLDGIGAYLDKYSQQFGIAASLETSPDAALVMPPRDEIQVIRVVQEALANVRKHSGASSAVVRIAQSEGSVTFAVEDDGRGFDPSETLLDRDGFGLHSMRERMELLGGTLLIDSAPGRGTRVVAKAPHVPARAPAPIPMDVDGAVG